MIEVKLQGGKVLQIKRAGRKNIENEVQRTKTKETENEGGNKHVSLIICFLILVENIVFVHNIIRAMNFTCYCMLTARFVSFEM